MNKCLVCDEETKNPKYCSRVCVYNYLKKHPFNDKFLNRFKKIKSYSKVDKKICLICYKEFTNAQALSRHLEAHKVTSKNYYDKFLIKNEGRKCFVCGDETRFINISKGYGKYCSVSCRAKYTKNRLGYKKERIISTFICQNCGNTFNIADTKLRVDRKFCSLKCANTYINEHQKGKNYHRN